MPWEKAKCLIMVILSLFSFPSGTGKRFCIRSYPIEIMIIMRQYVVLQIGIVFADLIALWTLRPVEVVMLLHCSFRCKGFLSDTDCSLVSVKVVALVKKLLQLIPLHVPVVNEAIHARLPIMLLLL